MVMRKRRKAVGLEWIFIIPIWIFLLITIIGLLNFGLQSSACKTVCEDVYNYTYERRASFKLCMCYDELNESSRFVPRIQNTTLKDDN